MKRTILIAEDEEKMGRVLEVNFQDRYRILLAKDGEEALRMFKENEVNLLLTDMKMPERDGLSLLHEVRRLRPEIPVILITAYGTIESAVNAMKEGAMDYLLKPIKMEEVELAIERAFLHADLVDENRQLKEEIKSLYGLDTIISKHPKINEIMGIVRQVAYSKATILIEGESGTGKELVARAIHFNSERVGFPFIVVNCSAIPRELLESELFGHEKGAFTGAGKKKIGSFELAHRGTLFLDEIGEMPKELQVKILRAIEGYRFMRVGGTEEIDVDVRLITATNRDLKTAVEAGEFREDLFYRLHVVSIKLPPLRDRKEDILPLFRSLLEQAARAEGRTAPLVERAAERDLLARPWPGHIRELAWCAMQALRMTSGPILGLLPAPGGGDETLCLPWPSAGPLERMLGELARSAEPILLRRAFEACGHDPAATATALGLSTRALAQRMRECQIPMEESPA